MKIEFICESNNVDLSKFIALNIGSKTTFETLDNGMIKITINWSGGNE